MNRTASKCKHCKKAFQHTKIDQKFCSSACRQAAYRKRQAAAKQAKKRGVERVAMTQDKTPILAICGHCGGGFFPKRGNGTFCSTSCRTLHHRALKAAIPDALAAAYGLPQTTAQDLVESQPMAKLRGLLGERGWAYQHDQRRWVQQIEMVSS